MKEITRNLIKETTTRVFQSGMAITCGCLIIPHFHNTVGLWALFILWSYSTFSFFYQRDLQPKLTMLEKENQELKRQLNITSQAHFAVSDNLDKINKSFAVMQTVSGMNHNELNALNGKIKEVSKQDGNNNKSTPQYQNNGQQKKANK